jgi:rod shape-determining protein MreC
MAFSRPAGRSRFTLFVLLLASVTLLTLDARGFGPVQRLEDGVAAVFSPLRGVGDSVFGPVGDAWSGVFDYGDLEAENEALRSQIADLQAQRINDEGAAEELAALREQLDLRNSLEFDSVVAEVVAGSISNFDGFVVEINRGRDDGVREGMPVLTAGGGLIGRVDEAGRQRSRIQLISDPAMSVGALVVGTEEVAIVSGGGQDAPLEVGRGSVRVAAEVDVGDVLVSAGGERSPYPPGLPIGTVSEVITDEGALEKRLLVEPTERPERLRFVTVVLFDPGDVVPSDVTEEDDSGGAAADDPTEPDEGDGG